MSVKIQDVTGSKQLLKDILPQSHYIDIRVRLNGEYYWFEGDFLKQVLSDVEFKKESNGVQATLSSHMELELPRFQVSTDNPEDKKYAELLQYAIQDKLSKYSGLIKKT
jgi:hypothetical protein